MDALVRRSCLSRLALLAVLAACGGCLGTPPPPNDGRTAVWIDADPAIGEPERGVDDGFALVQAFNSESIGVRGVSAVFGNVPLVRTWPIIKDLVERFGPPGAHATRGAAGMHERLAPTEASEALATALRVERLTIVALGPLTTIASTLSRDPDLRARVVRVVAVAGQRASQPITDDAAEPGDGHDLNVELDPEALRIVLDSGVPVTLAPRELAAPVWITADDLARLAQGSEAARFLAESSKNWLRQRQESSGEPGFHPTDTLAVDLVAAPGRFACIDGYASFEAASDQASATGTSTAETKLVVSERGAGRPVTYCHTPDAAFKERLMATLLRGR